MTEPGRARFEEQNIQPSDQDSHDELDKNMERQFSSRWPLDARDFHILVGSGAGVDNDQEFVTDQERLDIVQFTLTAIEKHRPIAGSSWVNIGAGAGFDQYQLRVEFGHTGPSTGVEPYLSPEEKITTELNPENLRKIIADLPPTEHTETLIASAILANKEIGPSNPDDLDFSKYDEILPFDIIKGSATDIPLEDNHADFLSAFRMFYCLPPEDHDAAFTEIKRVLKPDGILVLTTSGWRHRRKERDFLGDIGSHLGAVPKQPLNHRFTTETASKVIPQKFNYVYLFKQSKEIVINDWLTIRSGMNSLRSVRDQLDKKPSPEEFEKALWKIYFPMVYYQMVIGKPYVDNTDYSSFLASDQEIKGLPKNFKRIYPPLKKVAKNR